MPPAIIDHNIPRAIVPCGACSLCCRFSVTPVGVEEQAREQYLASVTDVPGIGRIWALQHRADGACTYLGSDDRCTVWDRAPAACKSFDCRVQYKRLSRARRREVARKVPLWGEIWRAALERGATEPDA